MLPHMHDATDVAHYAHMPRPPLIFEHKERAAMAAVRELFSKSVGTCHREACDGVSDGVASEVVVGRSDVGHWTLDVRGTWLAWSIKRLPRA